MAPDEAGAAVEYAVLGIDGFGIGGGAGVGARRMAGDKIIDFQPVLDGANALFEAVLIFGHDIGPRIVIHTRLSDYDYH